jgi:hypothetical protein
MWWAMPTLLTYRRGPMARNSAIFSLAPTIWCMLSLQTAENNADLPFIRADEYLSFDTFAVH